MKGSLLREADGLRTFVLVFDKGDELMQGLRDFVSQQRLNASYFTAIGAFKEVVLRFFDPQKKEYKDIPIREQVEVLALNGNISRSGQQAERKIHAHVVVGKSDGTAHGGHVKEAFIWPTLEVVLNETPRHLVRTHDPETGLALIDLEAVAR